MDALWEHVPNSNFSQGMSRVRLRESRVELGTQIPLGDEQQHWQYNARGGGGGCCYGDAKNREFCEISVA